MHAIQFVKYSLPNVYRFKHEDDVEGLTKWVMSEYNYRVATKGEPKDRLHHYLMTYTENQYELHPLKSTTHESVNQWILVVFRIPPAIPNVLYTGCLVGQKATFQILSTTLQHNQWNDTQHMNLSSLVIIHGLQKNREQHTYLHTHPM